MRDLTEFRLSEWLRLVPLRHALKQIRNDAWLAGYTRSVVAATAGTTRDVTTTTLAIDGWPVMLSDTAGIRATDAFDICCRAIVIGYQACWPLTLKFESPPLSGLEKECMSWVCRDLFFPCPEPSRF